MKKLSIDLGTLNVPSEIMAYFRNAGIDAYNYAFVDTTNNRVLKYGMQYSVWSNQQGERVYRQAAHLVGWPFVPHSSNGSDIKNIIKRYNERYTTTLDRFDISIKVWDQTETTSIGFSVKRNCEIFERNLIDQHIDVFGVAPIGNVDSATISKQYYSKHIQPKITDIFVEGR